MMTVKHIAYPRNCEAHSISPWPRGVSCNIKPRRQNRDSTANQTKRTGFMTDQDVATLSRSVERDLRLDLFRGAGLWMIFLDHVPHDVVACFFFQAEDGIRALYVTGVQTCALPI